MHTVTLIRACHRQDAVAILLYKGRLFQPKLSPEQAELQILSYTDSHGQRSARGTTGD